MRTTVRIDEMVYREAKAEAARLGMTLTRFVEEALRQRIAEFRQRDAARQREIEERNRLMDPLLGLALTETSRQARTLRNPVPVLPRMENHLPHRPTSLTAHSIFARGKLRPTKGSERWAPGVRRRLDGMVAQTVSPGLIILRHPAEFGV
jgi:hypothetical protein